jgi:hypothetical protein
VKAQGKAELGDLTGERLGMLKVSSARSLSRILAIRMTVTPAGVMPRDGSRPALTQAARHGKASCWCSGCRVPDHPVTRFSAPPLCIAT